MLTQSFNMMTRQLEEARSLVERNQREIEQAHARLVSVLANITAGVMVLDARWCLTLANPGAEDILGCRLSEHLLLPISEVPRLAPLSDDIQLAFNELQATGAASWQRQFVLPSQDTGQGLAAWGAEQTILARGSMLPGEGFVLVFDDLTEVISAQRTIAWAEVARRLAHEIKNPLTPIQLSAERLRRKLSDKLLPPDAELLARGSQTIVDQVSALKHLVDEFRDYARLPSAKLAPLELNRLVDEILGLYASNERGVRLHADLSPSLPALMGDASQLRQVIHNLVGNALEATERAAQPHISLFTERVALSDGSPAVRLVVRDNGPGFAPSMLARAFEPYATSKPRGTGLGLAIVKKIMDEHGARIDLANLSDDAGQIGGAQISLLFTKLAKSEENPRLIAVTTE